MRHLAKNLYRKLCLFVAWLIISSAILLTLLRLFLPLLDLSPIRAEIERVAEAVAGMPLRIGSMHAQMHNAHLALHLTDISLVDPKTGIPRLHLREAHADIHLLRSLLRGELILGRGRVVGARLEIVRYPDGSLTVNGFKEGLGEGRGSLAGLFLRRTQLRLRDSEIHWKDLASEAEPLHFSRVNANLFNSDVRHRLIASARLGSGSSEQVHLMVDLLEGTDDPLALNGQLFLQTGAVELGRYVADHLPWGLRVGNGRLDLRLWGELEQGRLTRLQGVTELRDLELNAGKASAFSLERLSSLFDWHHRADGWQLDLDRLVMMYDRQLWPSGRLSLAGKSDASGQQLLRVGADYLDVKAVAHFASLLEPAGERLRQTLAGLSPEGHLSRFRLAIQQREREALRWRVGGSITQYRNRPWQGVPGLTGVALQFQGNQDGGALQLGSRQVEVEMPNLFRDKLTANALNGNFIWNFSPQSGLRLKTSDLYLSTDHLETYSRLDLRLPLDGESPVLDMQTDFWDGLGEHKSRYLPVGIMSEPLVDWLDGAIVSGHVKSGAMLLYGPLRAFPYNNHEGRFEVLFGVEDLVLDYMADWPRLEEVVAQAHFLNNSLQIRVFDGKMLDTDLQRATVRIRHLKEASPVEVQGSLSGPLRDLFRVLEETPLKQQFGKYTAALAPGGRSRTWLDLRIPLKQRDSWRIKGNIDFKQATVKIREHDLFIDALDGRLQFDETQIWCSDVKGRLLDQPVVFTIEPRDVEGETFTRVGARMRVASDWLRKQFDPGFLDSLEGETQADVYLDITHGESETPVRLSIHSDMRGMAVELPAPLGKAQEQARRFDLELAFQEGQKRGLKVSYGNDLHALLQDDGQGYRRGDILLGPGPPRIPYSSLFRLRGAIDRLDLNQWIGWIDQARQEMSPQETAVPVQVDLEVEELRLAGLACADARIQLGRIADGWQVSLDSDALSGTLTLPLDIDQGPVRGHLKQLKLKSRELIPEPGRTGGQMAWAEADPGRLPALDLLIDSLLIDAKPFGKALLQWKRVPQGIQLTKLAIVGDKLQLNGQGHWFKTNGRQSTRLELSGHVASLGQLQEDLELQLGVAGASMDFTATLNWPLPPHALKLEQLSGNLDLKLGAGEVTEVDPGVGRLVGLFSLHALGKRLLLDFSDLSAKGLQFDQIEGSFTLEDGDAYTRDLELIGPAVQIKVAGRTGLATRDYDQLIAVTPQVSSTLPIVGALAVNPTVGVALMVAQQLFGKQMDRITQTEYQLTGDWESPQIVKLSREPAETDAASLMPDLPGDE